MPSYAGRVESLLGGTTPKTVKVGGQRIELNWNDAYDNPEFKKQADKGPLPEIFKGKYGGENPPAYTPEGMRWVATGTGIRPRTVTGGAGVNAYSESRVDYTDRLPIWELIGNGSPAKSSSDSNQSSSAAPQVAKNDAPTAALSARRDAYDRAVQFQEENKAGDRAPAPTDPLSPDFYGGMNAYGKAVVDDYMRSQTTQQRKVELGIDENAFYGNQSLARIDPKKMAVTKPNTFGDMVSQLKELRGLIT